MKNSKLFSLMAGLALSATTCGCQSLGTVARGQSPAPMPEQMAAVNSVGHEVAAPALPADLVPQFQTPHTASEVQGIQDHMQSMENHHAYTTNHYSDTVQAGPEGAYPGGICQNGYCPNGGCQSCGAGNGFDWYPKHYSSYSYQVPNDLRYPQQNQPGGAIVYPYYTHKGPSDFFRK